MNRALLVRDADGKQTVAAAGLTSAKPPDDSLL